MTSAVAPKSNVLWIQVWGLALVQGAIALTWVIYNLYFVELLTRFSFPAALATTLVVLENILAAVTEPLMGSFSDGLQHRMGTRFPFRGCLRSPQCYFRSPLAPLEKGGITFKVPLFKGDLGGSVLFQRVIKYFSNILLLPWASLLPRPVF